MATEPTRYWIVLNAVGWEAVTVNDVPIVPPPGAPDRWLPVFFDEAAARAFAGPDAQIVEGHDAC